jgi:hypothetical protein
MLIIGSDDGVYRVTDIDGSDQNAVRAHDTGRVRRVRDFDGVGGVFAATETGLYHSPGGEVWTNLGVPEERVYAVGASPGGDRLYAGTRPAHLYVARPDGSVGSGSDLTWRELDGFQELPSREEWQLPRHEDLAQVRDVHVHPGAPDRVVAGVEVGGVHVSEDGGDTWTERREGVNDDVHELHLVGPEEFVAATGFGLYRTVDAGGSWTRLDDGYEQRYFRTAFSVDGVLYAGGALANSSTWNDADADPELFVSRDGEAVEPVEYPCPDETVTGLTAVDGTVVAATHGGSVMVRDSGEWTVAASFPVPGDVTGRYTPLLWLEDGPTKTR